MEGQIPHPVSPRTRDKGGAPDSSQDFIFKIGEEAYRATWTVKIIPGRIIETLRLSRFRAATEVL
jgi:hypothetical protein